MNGNAITTYFRGINLIYADKSGTQTYYHFNAHGDVVALTNSSGTKTKTYSYNAFGVEYNPGTYDTNPFRYCGEYYDTVSGTIYLRARYYNSDLGRFTQEDTHWDTSNMIYGDFPVATLYSYAPNHYAILQSSNLYGYCGNNPLKYVDPTGKILLEALIFIGISTLVGGAAGAFIASCNDENDTGDIIEGAIEGALTGAAAATIGFFMPQTIVIAGVTVSGTVASLGLGLVAGAAIDCCVQVGSYLMEDDEEKQFSIDVPRMVETAVTTSLCAGVPVFEGCKESMALAFGSAVVGFDASVLIASGTIIYHEAVDVMQASEQTYETQDKIAAYGSNNLNNHWDRRICYEAFY